MAYTINHYNGTPITTIADGTVDATLDLKLIGKNYAGYGQIQNENFVYLLENFADSRAPSNPQIGQIWFDSGASKLKFFDNNGAWRTTGGAEIGDTAPGGLTQGDFWFDTDTNQLFAQTGSGFILIGPQAVKGSSTTEMLSTSVKDVFGGNHTVIQAIDNGETIFIISQDDHFTLDQSIQSSNIPGFTEVHPGVTLCYTNATTGVTTGNWRFWGTSSNADKLGGLDASSYVQAGSAAFSSLVNFADVGYTVGNPTTRLHVYNDNATTPTIANESNSTIVFKTTVSNNPVTPLQLIGADVVPGTTATSKLGTQSLAWSDVWATNFHGIATEAAGLSFNTSIAYPSAATSPNTVVIRDASSNVNANVFNGSSTTSFYADLAEKYLADADYDVGTVVCVGGEKEVTACSSGKRALGAVSANPAHLMNNELVDGTAIALKGRVPVKVIGPVKKGDQMIAAEDGCAIAWGSGSTNVFAIALESNDMPGIKLVECVIL